MSERKKLLEQAEACNKKQAELDKDMPSIRYININGADYTSGVIVYDALADDLRIQRNNSTCEVQFKGDQIDMLLSALKGLLEGGKE